MVPVALTIAGSDPSGGAGIQADLKAFYAHGAYGAAAITLLTVQNTVAVTRVELVDAALVGEQIEAVLTDLPVGAAKTGALGGATIIEAVAACLAPRGGLPLVVDPVMVSKHGAPLLPPSAIEVFRRLLLPRASLLTPNVPEAEALTGRAISSLRDAEDAARALVDLGARAVLVKGGHLASRDATDLLLADDRVVHLPAQRIETNQTHGTGCSYSAAITAWLARGLALEEAVTRSKDWISRAIATAPGLGRGHGPVNHFALPFLEER